jgi:uncharacterized membrane protein
MKLLITMSILAIGLQFGSAAFAQEPSASVASPEKGARGMRMPLGNLSPEEREKVRGAYQKAMQDPALAGVREKMRQAQKELREAIRASMLKADPSVKPILDKLPQNAREEN